MKYAVVIIVVICIVVALLIAAKPKDAQTPTEDAGVSNARLVIETAESIGDDLSEMTDAQRTVYAIYWYESEIMNGGILQFFDNSSGECAPFVSEALSTVGAEKHKALFDAFIADNGINTDNVNTDEIDEDISDDFDEKFYDLEIEETLEALLAAYIKANADII